MEDEYHLNVSCEDALNRIMLEIADINRNLPDSLKGLYPGHPDSKKIINEIPSEFLGYLSLKFSRFTDVEIMLLNCGLEVLKKHPQKVKMQPALAILQSAVNVTLTTRHIEIQNNTFYAK